MIAAFEHAFGVAPQATGQAPGRVNLIGDHTDYADGFCLPMALAHVTDVAMARAERFEAASLSNNERRFFDPHGPAQGDWTDYIAGSLAALTQYGVSVPPVAVMVQSQVPQGAGVSSSAALEVATIRAALALVGETLDDSTVARLAQKAENEYCGVQCGILDQMASACGRAGQALLLDCRDQQQRLIAVPPSFRFVVVHCGQERRLVEGAYNERRSSVERAASELGLTALRDATLDQVETLSDLILRKRARHVVSENQRVLAAVEALESGNAARLGDLMLESHHSLAHDFEVSTPGLDRLVVSAMAAGAEGARLTGAGFGGCVVALVVSDDMAGWWARVSADNPDAYLVQL
jgi:galactokinase